MQAHLLDLVDAAGVNRVATAAAADFRRIYARYGGRVAGEERGEGRGALLTPPEGGRRALPLPPFSQARQLMGVARSALQAGTWAAR